VEPERGVFSTGGRVLGLGRAGCAGFGARDGRHQGCSAGRPCRAEATAKAGRLPGSISIHGPVPAAPKAQHSPPAWGNAQASYHCKAPALKARFASSATTLAVLKRAFSAYLRYDFEFLGDAPG